MRAYIRYFYWLIVLLAVLAIVSCAGAAAPAASAVCADPAPSILSVFGGPDPNINFQQIATDFQQGEPMASWSGAVIPDMANIDENMFAFYTGHGDPTGWEMIGVSGMVSPTTMLLGNCTGSENGKLRYFVLSSCEVFAHGPPTCTNHVKPYGCPNEWNLTPGDSPDMRNVFARWGPTLGNNLRMACGSSTELDPTNASEILNRYNDTGSSTTGTSFFVADSIVGGLAQDAVGICLTTGGADLHDSPLASDTQFVTSGNTFPETHYHMQYSKPFAPEYSPMWMTMPLSALKAENAAAFPACLPTVNVSPEQALQLYTEDPKLDFDPAPSEDKYFQNAPTEEEYIKDAYNWLQENGSEQFFLGNPDESFFKRGRRPNAAQYYFYGVHNMLTRVNKEPETWPTEGQLVTQKNVLIVFRRQIDLRNDLPEDFANRPELEEYYKQLFDFYVKSEAEANYDPEKSSALINVIGAGGRLQMQLNNDGTVFNASQVWRDIKEIGKLYRMIRPDEALNTAQERLPENGGPFLLEWWNWGYYEAPSAVKEQSELQIWYQFYFTPNENEGFTSLEYPPRSVWILGHTNEECSSP